MASSYISLCEINYACSGAEARRKYMSGFRKSLTGVGGGIMLEDAWPGHPLGVLASCISSAEVQ